MMSKKAEAQAATPAGGSGQYPRRAGRGVEALSGYGDGTKSGALMEAVVERATMWEAYRRVICNKGSAGVDGMTCAELKDHLKAHWATIREKLLSGEYIPMAVRKVEIPKPQGGKRCLGIPTVQDRLIQQALVQVLQRVFEPGFSEHSYGFRPGRSAHQAVRQAQGYVREGRRWVVDLDLEKFFDRVGHAILMERVARKVSDERVCDLIRRYLRAGLLDGGVVSPRKEGTPQGGPLSPLLSNILLTDLDRELERRGHAFVRYADDCNIYVQTRRSGERVMASMSRYLERRLELKVNREKSAVDRPWKRKFLGYSLTAHRQARLKVALQSVKRFKEKLRRLWRQGRGRSLAAVVEALAPVLRGWVNYFQLAEVRNVFQMLDGWIRRRLRCLLWRQWKRPRTRARCLMRRGLAESRACASAGNGRGPWWNAGALHMNAAFPKAYFDRLGLVSLLDYQRRSQCLS
jgi:RNA-directed DNA polymerase